LPQDHNLFETLFATNTRYAEAFLIHSRLAQCNNEI